MKFILSMVAAFAAATVSASAQNSQLSQPQAIQVMVSISAEDMISLFQELDVPATFASEIEGNIKIIEVDADGASAYIALSECEGAGVAAACKLVGPFAYFNGTGVTLAQINTFNLTQTRLSFAGLLDNGNGIIATKVYLEGGVGVANFLFDLGYFFYDAAALLMAIEPGVIAQVNYTPDPNALGVSRQAASILDFDLPDGQVFKVNSVGRNAPTFMTDSLEALIKDPSKIRQPW
ncbi:MAG: hypothetical protein DHS20C05_17120 [Hyphococcus sp.]|nr:MAG: hypothetical protein DHS20C05_17120 [Marinicaulis sp.]